MARFTVTHTNARGGAYSVDYDDFERAIYEAGRNARGDARTEILCHDDGKVIPLAEAEEMLRQHDADMEEFERGLAELGEIESREADAQWEAMQRQERRNALARHYDNDPGGYILAVRELEDDENYQAMRSGL